MGNVRTETEQRSQETLGDEHALQIRLLGALEQALQNGADRAAIDDLFEQLISFTDAHFMSEGLLMRLHAYPEYEAHMEEHDQLITEIRTIQEIYSVDDSNDAVGHLGKLTPWVMRHMMTKDRAFEDFLKGDVAQTPMPV
ncbi:MAG: bacteriohemerythrin [Magnetovibrionaceae bacterium]